MQKIEKKHRRSRPGLCAALLAGGLLLLAALAVILSLPDTGTPPEAAHTETPQTVFSDRGTEEVARVTVTLRSGEQWTAEQQEDGSLLILGEDSFRAEPSMAREILASAAVVVSGEILSEDPAQWRDRLAEFGLEQPKLAAEILYRDGSSLTLRVGNRAADGESTFYYMSIDGDDRLMTLDIGSEEALDVERALLHPVTQPVIHRERIDRFTLTRADGREETWALNGSITDPDAEDRWMLLSPLRYAAEGETIGNLRTTLSNLRLGAWVGPADPGTLAACGLETPRLTVTVHMAEGSLVSTGVSGQVTEWPEGEVTLYVGAAKSELVDYVRFGNDVYKTSHFLLSALTDLNWRDTLTRYPVRVSLSNLTELRILENGRETVYLIRREAVTDEHGEPQTDDSGEPLYASSVTCDGQSMDWAAFEQQYNRLLLVTVSGELPQNWQTDDAPHTVYRFSTRTGLEHSITLSRFDALHDAVSVDGSAVFYLIRGGLRLGD